MVRDDLENNRESYHEGFSSHYKDFGFYYEMGSYYYKVWGSRVIYPDLRF